MNTREFTAEDGAHLDRLRELVNEAATHHPAAIDAADKGDKAALASAHIRLGRCIRSMQVRFAKMAGDAMQADLDANHKTQNSGGMGEGTSAPERNTPGLLTNDPAEFLKRARLGSRR
jgi:hypothetical protein